jgi:hypothetical protein
METMFDDKQEEICKYCYKYITDGIRGGNGWLCEGRYCDVAEIDYYDCTIEGRKFYRRKKLENLKLCLEL